MRTPLVAISLVLLALLFLAFFTGLMDTGVRGGSQETRDRIRCQSRLMNLVKAVRMYREDEGVYPASLARLVPQYVREDTTLCPRTESEGRPRPFLYFPPDETVGEHHLLFRSASSGYLASGSSSNIHLGIKLDATLVDLPSEATRMDSRDE